MAGEQPAEVQAFIEYLAVARGASVHTVAAYGRDVAGFAAFLAGGKREGRGPQNRNQEPGSQEPGKKIVWAAVGQADVERWLGWLAKDGNGPRSAARKLSAVRQFFSFMLEREWVADDPTEMVPLPKLPSTLPKALSMDEIRRLLDAPLGHAPAEVRLRLMIQLLYATGLRVSELVGLTLDAVEEGEGITLRVVGKGDKTRIVPLGQVAAQTMQAYLREARPRLRGADGRWVFAGPSGKRALTRVRVFQLLKEAGARVGVKVAPHHLRHTFATHLLQNDADLRAVQLMLGHASLNTTQIYTKVAQQRLRETLEKHHPLNSPRGRK
ncbi:MAG: tyrosine recombinase [Proteobacteria bacterium]|nr:tyrosine recombinase [Pseudomonadota bacterium]